MPDSCGSMPTQAVQTDDISPPICSKTPIGNSTHMDISTAEASNHDCHVSIGEPESQPKHQEADTPTQVCDQPPEDDTQSGGPSNFIKVDDDVYFRLKHSSYLDYLEKTVHDLREQLDKYEEENDDTSSDDNRHHQASDRGDGDELQVSFQFS